jgi:hypothetical protein
MLKNLNKLELELKLLKLFEDVSKQLKNEKDIDAFLDNTTLFHDWEKIIPDSEYPIFVMAVLNNIKRPIIVETIITSIIGNKDVETKNILKVEKKNNNFFDDAHPFS